jgi:hypothetical protein
MRLNVHLCKVQIGDCCYCLKHAFSDGINRVDLATIAELAAPDASGALPYLSTHWTRSSSI